MPEQFSLMLTESAGLVRRRGSSFRGSAPKLVAGKLHTLAKLASARLTRLSRLSDRYRLDDRRRGTSFLVYVLIGYKPQLWPFFLPRLEAAIPKDADVCLISPGLRDSGVADIARSRGWSYLSTATNDVSLAQNICLSLHAQAVMVCKLDEDMMLLPDTIVRTAQAYVDLRESGVAHPGFMAPLIPLNGVCYRWLLEALGIRKAYEAEFGVARLSTSNARVQRDPAAARWLWRRTAPLEATAEQLEKLPAQYIYCSVQFSIGAIVFERAFWEEIGMLPVYRLRLAMGESTLGGDEAYLCKAAVERARPGVVTTRALAGHFSFGPQYADMLSLLEEAPELFRAPLGSSQPKASVVRLVV